LVIEFALDECSGLFVAVKVRLFAGYFEVAAAREIAVDIFFAHDLLNTVDRLERSRIHLAHGLASVALEERGGGQLHASENHTAVARARAPANRFGLKDHGMHTALCERAGCRKTAKPATDNHDIRRIRQSA